jgi:SAM-dependent methyltransferase
MSTTTNASAFQHGFGSNLELQLSQLLIEGNDCLNRAEFDQALECLNRAVSLAPTNPDVFGHRAKLLWFLKHHDLARVDFSRAVEIDSHHLVGNVGLARCQIEKGLYAEAEASVRRGLTWAPQDHEAGEVLTTLKKLAAEKSVQAYNSIQQFYSNGREEFATVEPPPLSKWHLKHSRIVPNRENILEWMPQGGVCAEVGTQTGEFAKRILAHLKPAKLHIFDIDFTPFNHAAFAPFIQNGTVELHQGDSSSCLARQPNQSFDFIYIDGDHAYEGVTKDLAAAGQKIKPDGWIVCNDYTLYSPLEKIQYGVYRAVNEFCWQQGFEIVFLGLHSWGYHDVALRRMNLESVALAGSPPATIQAARARFQPQAGDGMAAATSEALETIGAGDEMFTGDRAHYFGVGKSALHAIETALAAASRSRNHIRKILDLPCGHGRVMRHLRAAFPHAQITACDLNHGAVDFCAQTFEAQPVYSNVDVGQIALTATYDLVWSGSLLTHLRAGPCADFVRLFNSLVNPGGLIVFTMHGRWVERSLATRRYTYGLRESDVVSILKEYAATGFGYADYPGVSGYGISISSPAFVLAKLVALPDLKLISYHEKGWDNHQDVICLQKQSANEPLG